ncbi:MAG TPA: LPXTG cell wall anchor domain-containing protein, partial [Acidimicrobiia bacterium]|nr:LPXTG cell wall anchor domain-containing protein [Acidimicrobiia bacterium]
GDNNQTGTEQPAAPAPGNDQVLENNVSVPEPAPSPGMLPRTGRGLDQLTKFGAIMLFLGGIAVMSGRRRRDQQA